MSLNDKILNLEEWSLVRSHHPLREDMHVNPYRRIPKKTKEVLQVKSCLTMESMIMSYIPHRFQV